jgi:hypothetical protein
MQLDVLITVCDTQVSRKSLMISLDPCNIILRLDIQARIRLASRYTLNTSDTIAFSDTELYKNLPMMA